MEFFWCILVSTCIGICFKLFDRLKVNTFNAIVINYTLCLLMGSMMAPVAAWPFNPSILHSPWFVYDIILGLLFIIGFNLTAYTIQKIGMAQATLMQRMSIILTVSFTVLLFHEHFGILECAGLIFALLAILAINQQGDSFSIAHPGKFHPLLLLLLVFSAAVEILLYYVEKSGLVGHDQMAFTTHGFGCAGVAGWIALGWLWLKKRNTLSGRDIIGGILLGIPNFFSIYLLLVMLNKGWNGSIMYPLINVTVLLLMTFIAVVGFKEKLNRINWIGVVLAAFSILIIAYARNASDWKISF